MPKANTRGLSFQEIITRLNEYWRERGCLLMQPIDKEVGAGTFHGATFLRALGPEPWSCAYTQASRRPFDGRYGDNPNRMQHYYQYQVILKPPPLEVLEIYIDSLSALGIDRKRNDIRCVEDNWNSPSLGAWGVGWEIWCNGMEITQFTYFQQVGGIDLAPISCEITYGLERIAMYLQDVNNVFDITWGTDADGRPILYRELFWENERQNSHYNFEHADIDALRSRFKQGEESARRLIEAELPIPAHEQVLGLSHAFNLLDARKAISVIDRQNLILRMRQLACQCARIWLVSRERLGFPLAPAGDSPQSSHAKAPAAAAAGAPAEGQFTRAEGQALIGDVLFELGVEPLPVNNFVQLRDSFTDSVTKQLKEEGFACAQAQGIIAPNRIGIFIEGLEDKSAGKELSIAGPALPPDFDTSDAKAIAALPAAKGFAKSRGVSVDALQIDETGKRPRLVLKVAASAPDVAKALPEIMGRALAQLPIDTPMRWGRDNWAFARPVHWLTFLIGDKPMPASFFGKQSGRETRILQDGKLLTLDLKNAKDYFAAMQDHHQSSGWPFEIYLENLGEQLRALAQPIGGRALLSDSLLVEIAAITSTPHCLACQFDSSFLALPAELISYTLEHHQRCVTIAAKPGQLSNGFLCVADRSGDDVGNIRAGNEKVVAARLEDAMYFWSNDCKHSLAQWQTRLAKKEWFEGLGNYQQRIDRMKPLGQALARLHKADADALERVIELCKIDQTSEVVAEHPELEGVIGGHLLRHLKVGAAIADAVSEHTQPRSASDDVSSNTRSRLTALADRIDALVGLYTRYRADSSDADPYGIRRVCLGLIRTCLETPGTRSGDSGGEMAQLGFPLLRTLRVSFDSYVAQGLLEPGERKVDDLCSFALMRFAIWRQSTTGVAPNVVESAMGAFETEEIDLAKVDQRIGQIARVLADNKVNRTILTAYKRIRNILRTSPSEEGKEVDPQLFEASEESALLGWLDEAAAGQSDGESSAERFIRLAGLLESFFSAVMVQCEDMAVRQNRQALLSRIQLSMSRFADFDKLV